MTSTKLFRSNRSQAVRLPKDVALPPHVSEVRIVKQGSARLIVPVEDVWSSFFDAPVPEDARDFLAERDGGLRPRDPFADDPA